MNEIPLVVLGFGSVAQSLVSLLEDHDGYARDGVRLKLHAVFDRKGGVDARDVQQRSLVEAKRTRGSVTAAANGRLVELARVLSDGSGGVLVDASITDADTGEPGFTPAKQALERGWSAVFASKGPLVAHYEELSALSSRFGGRLGASAAVGIPLPTLEVGLLGLRGATLQRFRGVLNDTANQILRELESGGSLEHAVARARHDGIIEADPRLDLDGWDATYKLLILARAFWDPAIPLDAVDTRGVGSIGKAELDRARASEQRIRLVASGARYANGTIRLETRPELLEPDDPLYGLGPGEKGAVFETDTLGTITMRSSRGGPKTTAASVVKDVLNIALPPRL